MGCACCGIGRSCVVGSLLSGWIGRACGILGQAEFELSKGTRMALGWKSDVQWDST
jgi:hypothetical protein